MNEAQKIICSFQTDSTWNALTTRKEAESKAVEIINGEDGDKGYIFIDGSQVNYYAENHKFKIILG